MAIVFHTTMTLNSSEYTWAGALPTETEEMYDGNARDFYYSSRTPLTAHNGNAVINFETSSRGYGADDKPHKDNSSAVDRASLDPNDGPSTDSREDFHDRRPREFYGDSDSDENSKWIHRDKLARIESEELQAAGIILPRPKDRTRSKSQNRPRRDPSQDKLNSSGRSIAGSEYTARSRKNSTATSTTETRTADPASIASWDLRRPEEILEEAEAQKAASSSSGKSSSRIPVAKSSHVPIPTEHIARDTVLTRKRDPSPTDEDSITYPKTRARSGSTGNAPSKTTNAGTTPQSNKRVDSQQKKSSATASPVNRKTKPVNGTAGRPKTRGGPNKDSTSSTRPSTRSGEREFSITNSKPMEGDPPWMVSAYAPDPRLPPDQQLLPTVAKRLQQEKWEREGKFGNIYDKDFRPLTDSGFPKPPEVTGNSSEKDKTDADENKQEEKVVQDQKAEDSSTSKDWPLKPETKSPTLPGKGSSYSTIPKISDNRPVTSPLASPLPPGPQSQAGKPVVRLPEPPEETKQKKGCGCCIVM